MYAQLLVPLDGSDFAEKALAQAAELAHKFGSCITLMTVVPPPQLAAGGFIPDSAELYQRLRSASCDEAMSYLMQRAAKLRKDGLTVAIRVVEGEPVAECILKAGEDGVIDTIVMCTHGRSGIRRWVFGSVAEKVLRHTHLPVVLVRPQTQQ
jgi:nucleotide-binding universal stress UspA family protein